MKKRMQDVLSELIKNSQRNDREIAKKLKISQPTVSRTRKKLETENYIKEYTIVPDLSKMGFEIAAFISFDYKGEEDDLHNQLSKQSNVIFASKGDGSNNKNYIMATVHKDFTEYIKFIELFERKYREKITISEKFLIPLKNVTSEGTFLNLEGLINSL